MGKCFGGCGRYIPGDKKWCTSCGKSYMDSDAGFYDKDEEKLTGNGDLKVYEGEELRKLTGFEIGRTIEDLGTEGIPNDDKWIRHSIESIVGTLSEEEMKEAVEDIKLHIQNQQKLGKGMGD